RYLVAGIPKYTERVARCHSYSSSEESEVSRGRGYEIMNSSSARAPSRTREARMLPNSIGQAWTNGRAERSIGTTMEIHQLRYFVAVAEKASFSNAAEREHVSQSLLSQQI